jgi:hypothetical protein
VPDTINFEPLTDDERASFEADAPEAEPNKGNAPSKPPAEAEPAEQAAAGLFGRRPDMFWSYLDAEGSLVFCVARWNEADDKKKILPVSWIEGEGWTFAHWPNARPLYNLDKLAAQPDAPIVVCEGEKAADAAALIFSKKSIATTSCSGAGSPHKTDWTPLAGRCVLLWPDAINRARNTPAKSRRSSPTSDVRFR